MCFPAGARVGRGNACPFPVRALKSSPDEVGNQGEQHDQESGDPDEESGGELRGFDFFFVHRSGYAFGNSCKAWASSISMGTGRVGQPAPGTAVPAECRRERPRSCLCSCTQSLPRVAHTSEAGTNSLCPRSSSSTMLHVQRRIFMPGAPFFAGHRGTAGFFPGFCPNS